MNWMHIRAKQAAYTRILIKVGKGRPDYAPSPAPHVARDWKENTANAWLPYTNIWDNFPHELFLFFST